MIFKFILLVLILIYIFLILENVGGTSSKCADTIGTKRVLSRSFTIKEGAELPSRGLDRDLFPTKQKSVKQMFSVEGAKKVSKVISKFFIFNAIPFNAADSGPYFQSMIDEIAKVGPGVKGPSGYQIGGVYLNEEIEELENYISTFKGRWPVQGCTIMCDGWSTRTKHPIINFMIYSDRNMIYHSSVDCTNKKKKLNLFSH